MPRSYSYTEIRGTADPVVVTKTYDDATLSQINLDDLVDANLRAQAIANALIAAHSHPVPPQTILPGSLDVALMPNETMISIGANGEVYSDGVRLGTARVSKLIRAGASVYGKGATDGKWWRWTGAAWFNVVDIDPNILK